VPRAKYSEKTLTQHNKTEISLQVMSQHMAECTIHQISHVLLQYSPSLYEHKFTNLFTFSQNLPARISNMIAFIKSSATFNNCNNSAHLLPNNHRKCHFLFTHSLSPFQMASPYRKPPHCTAQSIQTDLIELKRMTTHHLAYLQVH
jgi:hypothetical protein